MSRPITPAPSTVHCAMVRTYHVSNEPMARATPHTDNDSPRTRGTMPPTTNAVDASAWANVMV
ncbi:MULTISPECIES: hypothetical protein [Salinibacter]|uniref:hypothetical protein n=1 Tax=Salinibacter TaxID=146918 RepID=UPI0021E990A5|nr:MULTISPECIES: hypothetical protein [Salinibacter]